MVTKELLEYIKSELAKGKSFDLVKSTLLQNGWNIFDTEEARKSLGLTMQSSPIPPPIIPKPIGSTTPLQSTIPNSYIPQIIPIDPGPVAPPISKKPNNFLKVFIIVIILLVIIASAGAAYGYYSGFFISLEKISSEAYKSIQDSKSGAFDTTISIDLSKLSTSSTGSLDLMSMGSLGQNLSISAKGAYDMFNPESYKLNTILSLNAGAFSGEVEVRLKDHIFYGTLSKAPNISFIPLLSEYSNKWFSFPLNSPTDPAASPTPSIETNPVSVLPFMSILGIDASTLDKLSQEQKDYLLKITQNASFITIVKKFSPEAINDVPSYHFTFDLNREGIKNYLLEIETYLHTSGKNDSFLSSFSTKEIQDRINKIASFSGEVWIGKADHRPYKIIIGFDAGKVISETDTLNIKIVSIFKDWDKPTEVIVPTEVTTFESMLGGIMEESKLKSEDSTIKNYMTQAIQEIETFYTKNKNSYVKLCDSTEVKIIQNKIIDKKGFVCKASRSSYALSAILSDKSYWCIDSTGFNNSKTKPITTTSCSK